jgi:hypothetical protein
MVCAMCAGKEVNMPASDKLFSVQYFPPIQFFKYAFSEGNKILERHDNFQKQSYRNRCEIYSPMGKMNLVVPVVHGKTERQLSADIKISYDTNWVKVHVKSLEAAYRSSAYFEYYEDEIRQIYAKKAERLYDLNMAALEWVIKKLDLENTFSYSEKYQESFGGLDLREHIHPKKASDENFAEYHQVFAPKHGFIPNLSILDLLFNLGPQSRMYIRQL